MKEIPVTFKSHGKQIVGMLHLPTRKDAPVIVICHGYFGSKTGAFYLHTDSAREFCRKGFAVLRFDYRCSGDSEGKFENQRIKTVLEDFDSAMKFLKTIGSIDIGKVGVVGHSMGGTIAILSARKHKNIKCLVAWATVADYKKLLWDEEWLKDALKKGYVDRFSFGYRVPVDKTTEMFKYNIPKEVKKLKIPVMFAHGSNDHDVPFSHSRWLFEKTKGPKKLVKIEGADHLFVPQIYRNKIIKETSDWFERWLK